MKRKLTPTQDKLYNELKKYISVSTSKPYGSLEQLCKPTFKSFAGTFNALFDKGWLESVSSGDSIYQDYDNRFRLK